MQFPDVQNIPINPAFTDVFFAVLIVALAYGVATASAFTLEAFSNRFPARRLLFKRLQPIPQLGAYAVGGYLVLKILGPNQASLYAILGSMALALGLAAQDLVKDILGGLVVLIDKPYQIGDRIRVADYYGEVNHIGLRSTKLVTSANTLVTVPNSQILSAAVSNTNAGAVHCLVTTQHLSATASRPRHDREYRPRSGVDLQSSVCGQADKRVVQAGRHTGFDRDGN